MDRGMASLWGRWRWGLNRAGFVALNRKILLTQKKAVRPVHFSESGEILHQTRFYKGSTKLLTKKYIPTTIKFISNKSKWIERYRKSKFVLSSC